MLVPIPSQPRPPTAAQPSLASPYLPTFEELYEAHFAFVWRTLQRFGVATAQLDDACQDVFVVVYRRLTDLRPDSSPKAWLYAIAQRVASDQRRSARRKGNLMPLHEAIHSSERTPLDSAMVNQASDIVLAFLATLDRDQRAAFMLAELEQMSAPEVARIVEANLNTTYCRIAAARKAFAAFVKKHHGEQPRLRLPCRAYSTSL